jgi:hypothetical protein
MDGSAFGGSNRSGYSSVINPLKIFVRSTGLSVLDLVGLGATKPGCSPCLILLGGRGDFNAEGSPAAGEGV